MSEFVKHYRTHRTQKCLHCNHISLHKTISLYMSMVCDPNFRITSLCARWPGSCHGSRIWRTSSLCQQFENGMHDGLLLGDSGYPLTRYLMTPYLAPRTPAEERFNASLCRTRVLIEQTFGILKRKFQSLHFGLRTCPDQAVEYITATCILHNIAIDRQDTQVSYNICDLNIRDCQPQLLQDPAAPARNDGVLKRAAITNGFF
ncbi:putative nuclease HARBI1 [Crassostrea angulata]|uniref:putative nuclease HARBI1 n=1 Tax=Magallana angulata TaxID=2784310 RepID=UPI0022B1B7F6|nr:putative nuclease HARBI1 [Crassostrea angulata]